MVLLISPILLLIVAVGLVVASFRISGLRAPGKLEVLEHDRLVPGQGAYNGPGHYRTWVLRPTQEADLVMMPTDFKRIVYSYVFRKEIDQVTYEEAATLFR